ncbi:MAG: hypothetical protein ACI9HK_002460, partial [Pirellulaceae bacterium]
KRLDDKLSPDKCIDIPDNRFPDLTDPRLQNHSPLSCSGALVRTYHIHSFLLESRRRNMLGCGQFRQAVIILLAIALVAGWTTKLVALNPESPEVVAMIEKAAKYLETAEHKQLGGKALIALALIKADKNKYHDHARVADALSECYKYDKTSPPGNHIYSLSIATIFLIEHDKVKHGNLIDHFLKRMWALQMDHGGWGYSDRSRGDTSQTQYGVLCLWTAKHKGFDVPVERMEKVTDWLIRTQDPSGAWGYQAVLPTGGNRVAQVKISNSLVAAACGSLYIMGDALKLKGFATKRQQKQTGPVREIVDPKKKVLTKALSDKVNMGAFKKSIDDGDRWFGTNGSIPQSEWNYYYLYAIERYKSFKELAEEYIDKNPAWYNQGIGYLKKFQQQDGHFAEPKDSEEGGPEVATSFAVLFMVRSTQKTLNPSSGTTVGGFGLPDDLSSLSQDADGKVVKSEAEVSLETLLAEIGKGNTAILNKTANIPPELLSRDVGRLLVKRQLSNPDYQIRMKAVKSFSDAQKLQFVPHLLFALSDPDPVVTRIARDGLRKLSRKIEGFGLPDNPSVGQKETAQVRWQNWYLSIQPNAKLFD